MQQSTRTLDKVICIEGTDGTGKTTQANLLLQCLINNQLDAIYTREPGGGEEPIEHLRDAVLSRPPEKRLPPHLEVLIFSVDRSRHLKTKIKTAIKKGQWVVLDRFFLSTLVYQGGTTCSLINLSLQFHALLSSDYYPELTIVLEVDPKKILERIASKNHSDLNSFDDPQMALKHGELYKQALSDYKGRYVTVNGNGSIAEVHRAIIEALNTSLGLSLKALDLNT